MQKLTSLVGLLGLSGCIAASGGLNPEATPEQIRAMNEGGFSFAKCLTLTGLPVSGRATVLSFPKDSTVSIDFAPDCQIKTAIIGPKQ